MRLGHLHLRRVRARHRREVRYGKTSRVDFLLQGALLPRLYELVIGARFARMGVGYAGYAIEKLLEMTGQPLRVVSGVLHDECASLRLPPRA